MRAPVLPLACAFMAGVVLATRLALPYDGVPIVLAITGFLFALAVPLGRSARLGRGSAAVLLAYLLLGLAAGPARRGSDRQLLEIYGALGKESFVSPARVVGRLRREPSSGFDDTALTVDTERLEVAGKWYSARGGLRVRVSGELRDRLDPLAAMDRISFWGKLGEPAFFENPGGFDGEGYWERQRLELVASVKSALLVEVESEGSSLSSWSSRLRIRASRRIERALGAAADRATLGVLVALVTGERSMLSAEVEEQYRDAGTFHVMAISGAHVAMILVALYFVLRRLGCGEVATLWLLLVFLPLYAAFCGGRPPVVRAVLVTVTVLGARLLSLDRAPGNALALAALLLLLYEPNWLMDPGFQLSFAAMGTIVAFARPWSEGLRFLGPLRRPLAVSLAAQAGVVPIAAWHFHGFTPIAPIASLVAIPLAGVVVVLGLGLVLLADVPLVASGLALAARLGVAALSFSARVFSSMPGATLAVARPSLFWLVAYALVLLLLRARVGRLRAFALASVPALLAALVVGGGRPPPGRLVLTALDVGHGDALVLTLPEGQRVLVDGGGLPGSDLDVGERVVLPYLLDHGGRDLDVVVTTHSDFDHLGGLVRVVEAMNVREVWGGWPRWDRNLYREFRTAALRRGVPFRRLRPGAVLEWGGVRFEVLAAGGVSETDLAETENDRSVVLRVVFGASRLLLTGDAGHDVEEALLDRGREVEADVLKVGHHGSRGSSSEAFLEAVKPRLAILSARRATNRPLPSDEVLDRLGRLGIDSLRTDERGAITVRLDASGAMEVETVRRFSKVEGEARRQ